MVDALTETWRALKPGALLIDLRPYLPFRPLEVVADGRATILGRLDEADFDPDDPAADDALAEAFRRGLYRLESTSSFHYAAYWDSVADLREYLEDWADVARLPRSLATAARRALRDSGQDARLRLQTYMVVNRLRRLD